VTFTRREPDTRLLAAVSGHADDRFISQPQQTQPASCTVQNPDQCLPQKRGFYSSFDNTSTKLIPQTTIPTDSHFRTRASDSMLQCLYMRKLCIFVYTLYNKTMCISLYIHFRFEYQSKEITLDYSSSRHLHIRRSIHHEKRRGEQLKWSLAFTLCIGSFTYAQRPGPVHTARLGRMCVCLRI